MPRSIFVLAALSLSMALVLPTAQADVYKSIDAQGQVHYSDQWSAGAVLIRGNSSREPAEAVPAPAPSTQSQAPDSSKAAAKEEQSDMATVRAEQCKELKEQYAKEMRARRIYASSDDSSAPKQYLNDADADAERVKTRQAMDEACASGT